MSNKGRSSPNLFGGYTHYDSKGHKTGSSSPGLFGGYTNYDAEGHKIGHSDHGLFGGYNHYDAHGHKTGSSSPGLFGGYTHYDSKGHKIGSSDLGLFGDYNHSDSEGCYVATCIYGSYDCPQVWTLRRYRDFFLAKSFFGRLFIRAYYAVSPTLVSLFGQTARFRRVWSRFLDPLVARLQAKGIEDTPYEDRNW